MNQGQLPRIRVNEHARLGLERLGETERNAVWIALDPVAAWSAFYMWQSGEWVTARAHDRGRIEAFSPSACGHDDVTHERITSGTGDPPTPRTRITFNEVIRLTDDRYPGKAVYFGGDGTAWVMG